MPFTDRVVGRLRRGPSDSPALVDIARNRDEIQTARDRQDQRERNAELAAAQFPQEEP